MLTRGHRAHVPLRPESSRAAAAMDTRFDHREQGSDPASIVYPHGAAPAAGLAGTHPSAGRLSRQSPRSRQSPHSRHPSQTPAGNSIDGSGAYNVTVTAGGARQSAAWLRKTGISVISGSQPNRPNRPNRPNGPGPRPEKFSGPRGRLPAFRRLSSHPMEIIQLFDADFSLPEDFSAYFTD